MRELAVRRLAGLLRARLAEVDLEEVPEELYAKCDSHGDWDLTREPACPSPRDTGCTRTREGTG